MKKVIHFSLIANLLISVLLYGSCSDQNNDLTLTSPNKEHSLKLYNTNGVMQYDFIAFGDTVVKKSQLGFHKLDSFQITDTKVSDYDETWKTVWGANSEIRNHYNQLTVSLIGKSGLKFDLVSRIFDDGVAFRYVFPQQELDSIQLKDFTSFAFLNDHTIWYKGQHRKWNEPKKITISSKDKYEPPATIVIHDSLYTSIVQADIEHSLIMLLHNVGNNTLECDKPEDKVAIPYESAWRAMIVAKKPGGLVESQLVLNLNDEPEGDFSWVKPGKAFWDWRVRGAVFEDYTYCGHEVNTACCMHYIDKAAKMGIDYFLLDSNWYGDEHSPEADPATPIASLDMEALIKYAKEKGVGVWLYINDIGLRTHDPEKILETYSKWGAVGIKHGFLRNKGMNKVNHSMNILKSAAKHKLMYIQHEGYNPAGLQRKYPNYCGVEMGYTQMDGCTRGRENADYPDEVVAEKNKRLEILRELGDKNRLDDLCADVIVKPSYHIVNAFTMCLVGPKDFTPGAFDCNDGHLQKRMKFNAPLPSTINYQVALCNLIPSGILCLMDAPESYEQYPDMFEFIQKLPQTFDETKILDAEIGEYVIIARRKGDQWFISGITNEISREYSINFDFLGDDHFSGKLYLDNQGNHYLGEKEKHEISDLNEINPESVKSVYMVPGGGFNIWLEKVK